MLLYHLTSLCMMKSSWHSIIDASNAERYIKENAPHTYSVIAKYRKQYPGFSQDSITKLNQSTPYIPDVIDLARLHRLIIETKRTKMIEFGCGFSTLIASEAFSTLSTLFSTEKLKEIRRNDAFKVFTVDDQKEFIETCKGYFSSELNHFVDFTYSNVNMTYFKGRIATLYEKLPKSVPDFIYIDGPDQFNVQGSVQGWSTAYFDMVPMSADLLSIEYFLPKGTIVIVDGRSANVGFLLDHLKRPWTYTYHEVVDQHELTLGGRSFGKFNDELIKFHQG